MKPYFENKDVAQYCSDALQVLVDLPGDSVDLLATDPPYGISFMGKDWDKALPDTQVWKECLRILKPGAFAFVMSIPRSDCLSRMIISLEDAGFRVDFTPMYWAYASGFPKAQNIGKAVDKRSGTERTIVGKEMVDIGIQSGSMHSGRRSEVVERDKTIATSPQAQALDGSYGGFQPKPAVEVIIVAMKPLSEKTYVDQALKNQKGITWLDDARIPYEGGDSIIEKNPHTHRGNSKLYTEIYGEYQQSDYELPHGRFPANLLVSDDVLNDGRVSKSNSGMRGLSGRHDPGQGSEHNRIKPYTNTLRGVDDSGSFSRYFDLDKWAQKTFPFLIVPKASKGEKNKGLDGELQPIPYSDYRENFEATKSWVSEYPDGKARPMNTARNNHPTVKPLKLMSYLVTLGSRPGDVVLDPFSGSGTTLLAGRLLGRKVLGIEINEAYCEIAAHRLAQAVLNLI